MVIKEFHKKYIIADLLMILVFTVLIIIVLMRENLADISYYAAIISGLLVICVFLYNLGFESKRYYVNSIGICVTWLGLIRIKYKWEELQIIKTDTLVSFFGADFEENAIICSKLPLKKRDIYKGVDIGYGNVVDLGWVQNHPFKVIAILLKDLKPGQYEEFWSYVPERLKR